MRVPDLRRPTPATQELLAKLYASRSLLHRWTAPDGSASILEQLRKSNDPAAICGLMPLALSHHDAMRAQARSSIRYLLEQIPLDTLPALDEALRRSSPGLEDWHGLRPSSVDDITLNTGDDRIFLGLVASHRNGFVRAAAVRRLREEASGIEIPFLLLRLADWVGEVRIAATGAVLPKLLPQHAAIFVGCLGLLDRLTGNSRFAAACAEWIDDLLSRPECTWPLREGMQNASRVIRRHCYRAAFANPAIDRRDAILRAVADPDGVVRKWAFSTALLLLPDLEAEWIDRAANDSYAPVRRIAFEAWCVSPATPPGSLLHFLLDRSASLRRECQSLWARVAGETPAAFYRARIQQGNLASADINVLGLAETGKRDDFVLLPPLLTNASARVRRAVIRAMRVLDASAGEPLFLRTVASDVPSVAREAAFALLSNRTSPAGSVWAAASHNADPRVRCSTLRLLRSARKWEQLLFYLEAAADSDPQVAEAALDMISRWVLGFNSSFAQATESDTRTASRLIGPLRFRLAVPLLEQLEFILRTEAPTPRSP